MLDVREVKRQLYKIQELAFAKDDKSKNKAKSTYSRLRAMVFDDISKTGDQRVRGLLKALADFSAKDIL